jgi:hypothetical protein
MEMSGMLIVRRIVGFGLLSVVLGCGRDEVPLAAQPLPSAKPAAQPVSQAENALTGTVLETMDSGGYTYVEVQTKDGKKWAAGPVTKVSVGNEVRLVGGMMMRDFESKTLNRRFESILFVTQIAPKGSEDASAALPHGHPPIPGSKPSTSKHPTSRAVISPGSVAKAEGGYTVAEVYDKKKELSGREVAVRGQVVKFTPGIMGKNWLHIQDGTGQAESYDLTVTTAGTAKMGQIVVVRGKLGTDRDIGSGYFFPVLIEDAVISD